MKFSLAALSTGRLRSSPSEEGWQRHFSCCERNYKELSRSQGKGPCFASVTHCGSSLSHSWPWRTPCTPCPCSSSSTRSSRPSRSCWESKASSPSWRRWTPRSSPSCRSFCRASEGVSCGWGGQRAALCASLLGWWKDPLCKKQRDAKTTPFFYYKNSVNKCNSYITKITNLFLTRI